MRHGLCEVSNFSTNCARRWNACSPTPLELFDHQLEGAGHASGGTPIGSVGVEVEAANSGIEHPNEVDRLGRIVLDAESLVSCFLQHMRTPLQVPTLRQTRAVMMTWLTGAPCQAMRTGP